MVEKTEFARLARLIITAIALLHLTGCLDSVEEDASIAGQVDEESVVPPTTTGSAPRITGRPANAVKTGDTYEFIPSVSDPDGDPISLSTNNLPSWASFDSATGRIWGTPLLGHEGQYQNIQIVATDGTFTTSLDFTITVNAIGSASVTLSWAAPTENEDGTVLTNLAGYYIYYGLQEGAYTDSVRIDNPGLTTYVIGDLTPDTYYFVGTSFNTDGAESDFSGVAVKEALR